MTQTRPARSGSGRRRSVPAVTGVVVPRTPEAVVAAHRVCAAGRPLVTAGPGGRPEERAPARPQPPARLRAVRVAALGPGLATAAWAAIRRR
jgi:hypothetical protein